jgi:eukaryotic-like serine/threonine-protein kinase
VILGTAGYMSPEQVRGKPVDKRSDIFSFGCVLYEVLTGAGPFPGETVTDSLGAILHTEPNWALLPPTTPPRVRELLMNCLVKDRKNRLHDIGDARIELQRVIGGQEWASAAGGGVTPARSPRWGLAALVAVALFAAGWFTAMAFERPAPTAPAHALHVSTTIPAKPALVSVVGISPDARFAVYKAWAQPDGESTKPEGALVVRRLDRDETKVIAGTEGVLDAALSPDGRWLAFAAAKDRSLTKVTLKKFALDNGRPTGMAETLCDLPPTGWFSICWSSDREIVLASGWKQMILAVPASGGEPRVVLQEEQLNEIDNWGEVRPLVAGKSILVSRWALVGQTIKERTEVVDLATGKRTPLLANAGGAQLVMGKYVVARRNENSLIAAHLDLNTLQIIDEPVTVWSGSLTGSFFVSASGTLAMTVASGDISGRKLAWIDEKGQPELVGAPARPYGSIRLSPDGGRVATSMESSDRSELPTDMWIYDLSSRTFSRLPTQGASWSFVWSRDGLRLTHTLVNNEEFSIWERRADGSGESVKLYASPGVHTFVDPQDWSPDGKILAIMQVDVVNGAPDVLMLEPHTGSPTWKATPYLHSPAGESSLRMSPDGKWVRFTSDESGRNELYVQPFTGAAGGEDARSRRTRISTGGATDSGWWSPDGTEIRYFDSDSQLISVQVQTEPSFSVSPPKVLYSIKDLKIRDVTFAPDGRVMVVLQGENEQATKIDLVVNFADEVRARMADSK